ncbi:facilitated trehalose transporter Tret1-2 homolog [Penaeus japonicus]|uniref:facilitated trehalose transporter Tret1-2 homolog n=1 Tax=Penaeus japonicus TaxID=27405 RepID=UPI001C70FACC|nr:facilitated trehalose transporter Tret1-2 homolog [Penaeus japonicus]XP_042872928.1 facilitated trehalose transporter Tret1-2 homolog [Penaeus japonicus]XP_042872929.1 facilitated trehalose transporter Tret1-2 homolog [Penaeus japonicus]XP_042872930.1 facilitated trehalose transporter Tret1-2 homolog [Penaeus japonicus]
MGKYNIHLTSSTSPEDPVLTSSIKGIDNDAFTEQETHQNGHCNATSLQMKSLAEHTTQKDVEVFRSCEGAQIPRKSDPQLDQAHAETKPRLINQVAAAMVMAFVHVGIGAVYGYTGVTLPELTDPSSDDLILGPYEVAFFASLSDLGGAFGSIVGGLMLVRLGQRTTSLLALPMSGACWLAMAFAHSQTFLLAMWFFLGFVSGLLSPAASMYVLEVSHKDIRGFLFGIVTTARRIGIIFVFGIGSLRVGWRTIGFACSAVVAIPLTGLLFLPHSPRWLVTRGRFEEAKDSLSFFRGNSYDSSSELASITEQVDRTQRRKSGFSNQVRMIMEPSTRKALALMILLSLLSPFSGIVVVIGYAVPILQMNKANIDEYMGALLTSVVFAVGTVIHICIVDRIGRKPLLVTSFLFSTLCMGCLGGYFYLQTTVVDVSAYGWVPVASMVLFLFSVGIGQPVINIMQGELLPTSVRPTGISLIQIFMYLGSFASAFTYPLISSAVGEYGAFWLYGGVCLTIATIGGVCLPETRGRSLEEITKGASSHNTQD